MASLKAEKSGSSQPSGQVKKEPAAAKVSGTTPKTRASKATAPKKTEQKSQPKKKVYMHNI